MSTPETGLPDATKRMLRPWCCPEPSCTPVHQLGENVDGALGPTPGESFFCFGRMPADQPIEFVYDGATHRNDLRSCAYTPLKGVIAYQENADDWRAISNAYKRALDAIGGWGVPSIQQRAAVVSPSPTEEGPTAASSSTGPVD